MTLAVTHKIPQGGKSLGRPPLRVRGLVGWLAGFGGVGVIPGPSSDVGGPVAPPFFADAPKRPSAKVELGVME